MNTTKNSVKAINTSQKPHQFKRRLGSTTFHVNVHFDPSAKETAEDRIVRLIQSEVTLGTVVNL